MTPQSYDLLDEVVSVLRDNLAQTLTGATRYQALLTANAVATVRRECLAEAALMRAREALVSVTITSVRSGILDDDIDVHERLVAEAALRAWIANPATLDDTQRRRYLPGFGT